jgi:hypothetical protein
MYRLYDVRKILYFFFIFTQTAVVLHRVGNWLYAYGVLDWKLFDFWTSIPPRCLWADVGLTQTPMQRTHTRHRDWIPFFAFFLFDFSFSI